MTEYIDSLESDVLAEWRRKSQNLIYQTDPEAWLFDVLGRRWWSKQREAAWSFVENEFTLIKSCNGIGKTQLAGDLVTWFISVFPPRETIALVSAPVRNQIDENMFRYLRENYQLAIERNQRLIGEITRWPKWIIGDPYAKDLVLPKRPADSDLVSSFQGIHLDHVAVILDEAGGLQEDFYTAANAVTTNEHARIFGIGNPDRRNTAFHERFKDRAKHSHWNVITIGYNDTPNATGEVIYPDDPEMDAKVKSRMTQAKWAEMMRRSASPGIIAAKVDGEFPDTDDNTFFNQIAINKSWETFGLMTELGFTTRVKKTLGVDVAFAGEDKNVIYYNEGGKITLLDQWDKSGEDGEAGVEDMAIARRIHRHARDLGVDEVRVDAAGTSRGVHSVLKTENEFANREYILIGVVGSKASPDNRKWLNARAWHYDRFRIDMANGKIGIDMSDKDLKTDIEVMTAKYTLHQQLQISTKADIKKDLKHSPDHLDAAIYSAIDFSEFTDGPGAGSEPGDVILEGDDEMYDLAEMSGYGMPF